MCAKSVALPKRASCPDGVKDCVFCWETNRTFPSSIRFYDLVTHHASENKLRRIRAELFDFRLRRGIEQLLSLNFLWLNSWKSVTILAGIEQRAVLLVPSTVTDLGLG
jgi:hypothetical protein